MGKANYILIGAFVGIIGAMLLIRCCGNPITNFINNGGETVIYVDTVRHETVYDTTWYDTTIFKYVTVELTKPYYIHDTIDTTGYAATLQKFYAFDEETDLDFMMKHPSIYEDSMIQDDTVRLTYKATVRGYLDDLKIGYKIVKPFLVESNTVTDIEITKIKRPISFYMGLNAGANVAGPTQFSPMAEIVAPKMSYGLGYDILNSAIVISVKARISFRKKPRIIPRP